MEEAVRELLIYTATHVEACQEAELHEEHDRHISLLAELKKRDAGVLVRLVP